MEKIRVTRHCVNRYSERIKGKRNFQITFAYITNKERLEKEILKLFSTCTLIYSGKTSEKYECNHLYLHKRDGWLFVLNEAQDTIITLIKTPILLSENSENVTERCLEYLKNYNKTIIHKPFISKHLINQFEARAYKILSVKKSKKMQSTT